MAQFHKIVAAWREGCRPCYKRTDSIGLLLQCMCNDAVCLSENDDRDFEEWSYDQHKNLLNFLGM